MPAPTFYEKPRSRKTHRDSAGETLTRNWFCAGTSDRAEVMELALANNPRTYQGLLRKSVDITPLAPDVWDADVEYGIGKPTGLSPDTFTLKIGTQNVHINQSLRTKLRRRSADNAVVDEPVEPDPNDYEDGAEDPSYIADLAAYLIDHAAYVGTAPDHKQAIGVTSDSVTGCDILVPKMEFSITRQRADLTFEYVQTLFDLVGKTNSAPFFGFPANSVLYLGAEPTSSRGQLYDGTEFNVWTLAHQFAHERTRTEVTIGGIVVPKKKGFEFLWVHFGKVPVSRGMTQPPDAVYVEEVYDEGDFELLEIGTGETGEPGGEG